MSQVTEPLVYAGPEHSMKRGRLVTSLWPKSP